LATELGQKQQIIVSGLARGIDTHAHTAALATGTVAVIAGGINTIYPPENDKLYKAIAETGAIISEAPFGSQPLARSFPARNRIIAGMSTGTLVVEASLKSGSLITAEYALDYGRDVFAVPGSPMDPRAAGTNQLIRDGAVMVESAQDILQNLHPPSKLPLAESQGALFENAAPNFIDDVGIDAAREAVLKVLSAAPSLIDDVLVATGLSAHYVMAACLELELAGRITRHSGAKISLRLGDDDE
jgi:DNA processing protein